MKNAVRTILFLSLFAFSAGTVRAMGAHGKPFWKAQSQPDSLIKVTMTNGDVIYIHPADNIRQVEWGSPGTDITDLSNISTVAAANMDFKGKVNTKVIVSQLGNNGGKAYAAKLCDDLVAYGYDDWYLPAAGELNEMYKKPGPVANGGSGQITTGFYWSSSGYVNGFAWDSTSFPAIRSSSVKAAASVVVVSGDKLFNYFNIPRGAPPDSNRD